MQGKTDWENQIDRQIHRLKIKFIWEIQYYLSITCDDKRYESFELRLSFKKLHRTSDDCTMIQIQWHTKSTKYT